MRLRSLLRAWACCWGDWSGLRLRGGQGHPGRRLGVMYDLALAVTLVQSEAAANDL